MYVGIGKKKKCFDVTLFFPFLCFIAVEFLLHYCIYKLLTFSNCGIKQFPNYLDSPYREIYVY